MRTADDSAPDYAEFLRTYAKGSLAFSNDVRDVLNGAADQIEILRTEVARMKRVDDEANRLAIENSDLRTVTLPALQHALQVKHREAATLRAALETLSRASWDAVDVRCFAMDVLYETKAAP